MRQNDHLRNIVLGCLLVAILGGAIFFGLYGEGVANVGERFARAEYSLTKNQEVRANDAPLNCGYQNLTPNLKHTVKCVRHIYVQIRDVAVAAGAGPPPPAYRRGKLSVFSVANSASLLRTMSSAQAGDTILLAPGRYSGVNISNFKSDGITIASQDPNNPAKLYDLNVQSSKGLTFSGIELVSSPSGQPWAFKVMHSSDVHFNGVTVHGSMNGSPKDDGNGLKIGSSKNVSVTNSEFQQLKSALDIGGNNGIKVEGNYFHDIRVDGVVSTGASNVLIDGNYFTNFYHIGGDHSDAIQFFTANRTSSASNITITNNVISQGKGDVMQGVFMRDEVGNLPYINVKIAGNVIIGGNWNGISVTGGRGVEITDNYTTSTNVSNQSRIALNSVDGAVVSGNTASKFVLGATNLSQGGNGISANMPHAGNETLQLWLQKNPAYFLKLPEKLLDIIEGDLSGVGAGAPASSPSSGIPPEGVIVSPPVVEAPAVAGVKNGTAGNDLLNGDARANIIYGNIGNDTVYGGAGMDVLRGGQGNDQLFGGDGLDWLSGDRGDDTLTGGAGADTFNTFVDGGHDVITDFSRAQNDRIVLEGGAKYTTSQVGSDVVVTIVGGGEVVLQNVSLSSLTGGWIFS